MTEGPDKNAKSLTQLVALEIKLEMTRQDLRQSQLARMLGVTEQWMSVRLRGRQPIDLNDLERIADALAVPVHQLLPQPATANTLRNRGSAKKTRSAPISATRPARSDNRPPGRPSRGTTAPVTHRPAMIPRLRPA